VDPVICARKIGRCIKGKHFEKSKGRTIRKTAGEFLVDIKKEFGGGDKETVKVVELKRIE